MRRIYSVHAVECHGLGFLFVVSCFIFLSHPCVSWCDFPLPVFVLFSRPFFRRTPVSISLCVFDNSSVSPRQSCVFRVSACVLCASLVCDISTFWYILFFITSQICPCLRLRFFAVCRFRFLDYGFFIKARSLSV